MKNVSWSDAFKKDETLLEKIKETIKTTRKDLSKKYRDIGMGDAFYRGNHYGEWSDEGLSWKEEDINTDDRPRIVSNQIKVFVDKVTTKVTRYKPAIMATPMSNEQVDIKGSKISEELLHHKFLEQNIDDIHERWIKSSAKTGVGWVKVVFNPFLNEKIDDFDEQQLGEGIEVEVSKTNLYKGDIEYSTPRSINIIPDMVSNVFTKHRYLIEEMDIPLDTLKANYKKAAKLKTDMAGSSKTKSKNDNKKNMLRCWEIWFPPHPELPKGGYAIGTDELVLDKIMPYPEEHGKIPYIPIPFSSDDEYLWGDGVPQPLIPLQVEYNKIKNIRVENQNYAAALKFLNPLSSGFDGDLMTNEPGEVIDFDGQTPPGWSQPMTASSELTESLNEIKQEMQDISMVSATSQGRPPDSARSGIMLQYLIENDDAAFAPVIRRMERGLVELCYITLELMKQYYENEDDRYYKVIGKNKQYQLKKFKKTSLNGKYDILIQKSNANPLLKAYKMDTILQLIQYQVLDTKDRAFLAEALEVGNIKGAYEDVEVDKLRAEKEIDKIITGEPHQIMEYDDDDEHISTKVRYLKTEYDNLSEDQRASLTAAIKEHEEQLASKSPPPMMPPEGAPEGMPEMAPPTGEIIA